MFELRVAGIPAEVQGWVEAGERAAGVCDVAAPFCSLSCES